MSAPTDEPERAPEEPSAAPEEGGTAVAVAVAPAGAGTAPTVGGPLFFPNWRGPSAPPTRLLLGAAAATGLTTALVLPLERPGIGWFVAAVVTAVMVAAVARQAHRLDASPPARRAYAVDAAWALAAVGLVGVAAVRDAEWLISLCLLAAPCAASIAVAGRHFRSLVFSALAVPLAAVRALPWASRALWAARQGAGGQAARTVVAAVVGLCLLAVFAPLLASADRAFARLLDDLMPTVDDTGVARAVLFTLGAGAALGCGFVLLAPPPPPGPIASEPARLRRVEWTLPIGLLVALFGLFVGVQFATLFGSDDYVQRTTGVTYAEYARGGFWQLLAVTVLALGVVLLASRYAPAPTSADRAWKRTLLAALAALTLVIVASALSRMWLYQEAYGFTTLRLVVLTCELWLGACFLLVLGAVLRLRARPVVREMAAAGVVALLALAALDPDGFVAASNVDRYASTGQLDTWYLGSLSADAVPALARLPEEQRCEVLPRIAERMGPPEESWTAWNASRTAAREVLARTHC
ncbi:DUF4153 domain-containing protein [Pseudonocardia cypriaca]|uniref:Uncharacterized protein DUF4173 n=1 Tax=Pseudonocardia cypriaca TaxID=882449 RepID=A0A543GAZ9_9PSEU|nr:DUF4173 domain-containing protein [Pseudonocardia cypriaca]TQM43164.1 uncharacterized protein DUF4173 [Pseudonocardia cypriaca]